MTYGRIIRIGQVVPSSNTTMETEVPLMMTARQACTPERFSFHSSRMRMKNVTLDELATMDAESDRCALELSDAQVDVLAYACLVAIMSMGKGYHRVSEARLFQRTVENGSATPVVSSAGALVQGLQALRAKKVALITPYIKRLTQLVVDYLEAEGIEVLDCISLEIADNLAVGTHDPMVLTEISKRLRLANVDVIVISACVQMPSLPAIPIVEKRSGLPVVSAATCTVFQMLQVLKLAPVVPDAGVLLSEEQASLGSIASRTEVTG